MRLKHFFETIDMGDEIIMVPVGASAQQVHGVIKLNESGREIVGMLSGDTAEDEIVKALSEKYENDPAVLEDFVHRVVDTLRKNNLIEE